MKVVWRGKIAGHDVELCVCYHEGAGVYCESCGRARLADWLPFLPYRFYRPIFPQTLEP